LIDILITQQLYHIQYLEHLTIINLFYRFQS